MVSQPFVTAVAARLASDPEIAAICGDRVLDVDYRLSGWNSAPVEVTDQDGIMLTTLVVDDNGADRPLFGAGPQGAESGSIYVWAFGNRSLTARNEISVLMRRAKAMLDGWHDPATKAQVRFSIRIGSVTADDGVYDRTEFAVVGIPER